MVKFAILTVLFAALVLVGYGAYLLFHPKPVASERV